MARILLVDDDDQFRSMLRRVLAVAGHEVVEACDGREALTLYESGPVDLVITDLVMPGKEGLELIVELKQLHPEVRIIAISGGGRVGSQDYLKIARAFGACRVLAKPFSPREIIETITLVLQE